MKLAFCVLALVTVPAPVAAAPLEFSGINARTVAPDAATMSCLDLGPTYAPSCSLSRASFGGIELLNSNLSLNPETKRVAFVGLTFRDYWFDTAVKAMTAKYGVPTVDKSISAVNKQGGPYTQRRVEWHAFDNGSKVSLYSGSSTTSSLSVSFPENFRQAPTPKVDF